MTTARSTSLPPTTPVIVGVGQVNIDDADAPEPVDLLAQAARAAATDSGVPRLLEHLDAIRVVRLLTRSYRNPASLLAGRIGAAPRETAVSTDGGHTPQWLVNRAVEDIQAGRVDAVLIGGAESWRTRLAHKRRGSSPDWTVQGEEAPAPRVLGSDLDMFHEAEQALGLQLPVQAYPLFENALRAAAGTPVAEHRQQISELWARFSAVAADNPHAAIRTPLAAEEIATPASGNRMVASPYTKRQCSNSHVDQAAAVVVCSVEHARRMGVAADRWVFVHSGAQAQDVQYLSHRHDLRSSPAIRHAGRAALQAVGADVDELAHIDLYSCFPSAVQVAANELGLDLGRDLTVTGGLTFAGGPWNNYVTHAIATMVHRLREAPDTLGMCTANGGLLTKHAIGVYGARPPARPAQVHDVQPEVDAGPTRSLRPAVDDEASLETSTVMHARDGQRERAYVAALLDDDRRTWATTTDPDLMGELIEHETEGRRLVLRAGRVLDLV